MLYCSEVNLMLRHRSNINTSGILTYIQYLALDWVLYLVLILIADCGFFIKLYWWFWNLILATEDLNVVVDKQNNAVRREKEKVIVTRNFSSKSATMEYLKLMFTFFILFYF